MTNVPESSFKTKNTFFFALLTLFFIQLFGMWIESIYRLSLVKLSPGKELFGAALLLLPLGVYLLKERWERAGLWMAVVIFVAARLACPLLDALGQVIAGGVGVSMFLVILAYAFSACYSGLKGDLGQAFGIAVLLSVLLRSLGNSIDISEEWAASFVVWPLVGILVPRLFRSALGDAKDARMAVTVAGPRSAVVMLGLFANMALVCLVFSCPAVVCAWTGYTQLGYSGALTVGFLSVPFVVALLVAQRIYSPPRWLVVGWNVLLTGLLVGGCLAGRPMLPATAASPAVFVNGDVSFAKGMLYLALILSPVVVFNLRHIAGRLYFIRPRYAVLPLIAGGGFLFALAVLPILVNTWGYVPLGPLFRNRFYLPWLVAGPVMLLPWMLRPVNGLRPPRSRFLGALAVLLAVLAVAGSCWLAVIPPRPKALRDLTVLTYNMQQGSHLNGNRNYRKQLELIWSIHPDIIGLQECDTVRSSGGSVDAVRFFAESLGYYAYYGPGALAGTFGTAILSRYPIRNARTFFTYSDTDEVGTAVGEIEVDGKTVAFFSNHPAGGGGVMTAHVSALKAEAAKYEYVIAVGDYNFTPREPYFASLSELLQDSAAVVGEVMVRERGWSQSNLADEIDHIFVSRNVLVWESHYLAPPASETDHPAHWAVLSLKERQRN